ncbi:phosphatase PAP2 family protein [Streptomyces sp. BI20]|uniref:phosphatase PAP2 family protein n=1 Tax=Streptomyces sp. BI20 TaxID=3403460 RepID=UPI003C71FEDB
MAGLTSGGPNVDVSLLHAVDRVAGTAPDWIHRAVGVTGSQLIPLALALLVLWCWRAVRRGPADAAPEGFAALVWAPLAAGIALLVNVPLREFVGRPGPVPGQPALDPGGAGVGFSFVSDHTTLAMAVAVGLFMARRRYGAIGIALALLEGVCRLWMGVHYPTDVVGGLALGTAVTLLPAPLAMAALTPLVRAVADSPRAGRLVRAKGPRVVDPVAPLPGPVGERPRASDLAA